MATTKYEAENATHNYSFTNETTDFPGWSGTGYIQYGNYVGSSVLFTVTGAVTGNHTMRVACGGYNPQGSGLCRKNLIVNSVSAGTVDLPVTSYGTWYTSFTKVVSLNSGALNTIEFTHDTTYDDNDVYFDYIEIIDPEGQPINKRWGGIPFSGRGSAGRW